MPSVLTTGDNKFGVAKWIVDPVAGQGTHTTIQAALTAASSGDTIFLRPGTYTENPTLKAGVNIVSFICDALTPNVTILGKCTASFSGSCTISGVRLQTNGDFFLVVSGAVGTATVVNLINCYLYAQNNTGISYTCSEPTSSITKSFCYYEFGGNYAMTVSTGAGLFRVVNCNCLKSQSSTASTFANGKVEKFNSYITLPLIFTNIQASSMNFCRIDTAAASVTSITTNTSGTLDLQNCYIQSGNAQAVAVNNGTTVTFNECAINSNEVNGIAISGTSGGICNVSPIAFENTASIVNPATMTISDFGLGRSGTWNPTLTFGGGSTGITYSSRAGKYWVIGKMVFCSFHMLLSSKGTSTGSAAISIPFTSANDSCNRMWPAYFSISALPTNTDTMYLKLIANTSVVEPAGFGSSTLTTLTNSHFSNTSRIQSSFYFWTV